MSPVRRLRWRGALLAVACCWLGASRTCAQQDNVYVHDPRLAKQGDWYYVFSTGAGIPVWRSRDLFTWERTGPVFDAEPPWAVADFPNGYYIWAPDIIRFGGKYHLYYAISRFGRADSVMGHATNATLNPADPSFKWIDQGKVIQTRQGDDWNAIDPGVVIDEQHTPWLVAGSFWSGIKLIRLDPETGAAADDKLPSLAARRAPRGIEAGYIIHHGEHYYLFVSFDICCRGARSTYKIVVGRSRNVTGPYVDIAGQPMMDGGGSLVLASYGHVRGPGHNGVFAEANRTLLVHHYYDANDRGRSKLQIRPLLWGANDWPVAGEPITRPVSVSPQASTQASTRPSTQPSLAGRWAFSTDFDDSLEVEFKPDGSTAPDVGRWQQTGDILGLKLPGMVRRNSVPVSCFLDPERQWFVGRDPQGAVIRGVRID